VKDLVAETSIGLRATRSFTVFRMTNSDFSACLPFLYTL
jgi:hypothetical protein